MAYDSHRGGAALRVRRLSIPGDTLERLAARSRETFGEEDGLNIGAISRIETGHYQKPAFEDIAKLAYLLQVDLPSVAEWYGLPAYGSTPEPAEHEVIKSIKRATRGASQLDELRLMERLKATLAYWMDDIQRAAQQQRRGRRPVPSEPMQEISTS